MAHPSPTSVPSAALRCPILSARAAGLPIEALLKTTGLDPKAFEARAPAFEVPLPRAVAILESLVESGPPGWALRGAADLTPGAMGVLDHLCAAAPTIGASLEELVRYFALAAMGARLELRRSDDELALALAFPGMPESMATVFVESTLGLTWSRLRAYSGIDELRPRRLELRSSASPSVLEQWERAIGVTPALGMPHDRLVVPGEVARQPLTGHDPALRAFLADLAATQMPEGPTPPTASDSWADRVATSLRAARPDAELRQIARALAVGERTLRRRLAEEGTSFSELRQQELRRRAQALLSDDRLSPAEVAFSLGFSEMSAFHRAFKRWTGHTPGQWRELH